MLSSDATIIEITTVSPHIINQGFKVVSTYRSSLEMLNNLTDLYECQHYWSVNISATTNLFSKR